MNQMYKYYVNIFKTFRIFFFFSANFKWKSVFFFPFVLLLLLNPNSNFSSVLM